MVVWSGLLLLPDTDVLGFRFGISYAHAYGHRGATHSIAFACFVACLAGGFAFLAKLPVGRTMLMVALVLISHGLLDTLTDGGLGCALFWPFSDTRYFAPWTPIPVAPIGRAYLSRIGREVAVTELVLFAPVLAYALWPKARPVPVEERASPE